MGECCSYVKAGLAFSVLKTTDRKSTRLNSSHLVISYAVFCLKKKTHDSYLMRLAHSIADTLVTPLNDSFLDLDVLATLDPVTFDVIGISHYGELVRETRRHRRPVDGALIDWGVGRNRVSRQGPATAPVLCGCWQERALNAGFLC